MVAQHPRQLRRFIVVGDEHSGVAEGTQIFCRVKRKRARVAQGAGVFAEDFRRGVVGLSTAVARAEGLGAVLEHFQTVSLGHLHNPRHGGGVAVEVNGQNRSSAFGDGGLELVRVQVEGALVHVDKNGRRADGN